MIDLVLCAWSRQVRCVWCQLLLCRWEWKQREPEMPRLQWWRPDKKRLHPRSWYCAGRGCQSKFAKGMCFGPLFAALNSSVRVSGSDWPGAGHRCRVFGSASVSGSKLAPLCDACPSTMDISQRFVTPTESGVAECFSLGCCMWLLTPEQGQPHHSGAMAHPWHCHFSVASPAASRKGLKRSQVWQRLFISAIPVTSPGASLGTNNLAV